jgi:hypothetical protein
MVWTLDVKPDRSGVVPGSRRNFARIDSVVSIRMGADGAMYFVSYVGSIHRVAPLSVPASCSAAAGPTQASDSGAESGSASGDSSGCSCNLAARRPSALAPLAALAGVLLAWLAIRRR